MATSPQTASRPPSQFKFSWTDPTVRSVFWQLVVVAVTGFCVWWLISTTMANLARRGIASGFGYFWREAGLPIGEALIDYAPTDMYFRALIVGVLNTLRIAILGVILATILGTIIGIARLSKNWIIARLAYVYVELMRNMPLLLQLLFWYSLLQALPPLRQAINPLPGVFLSQRGLYYPVPEMEAQHQVAWWALLLGVVAAYVVRRWAKQRQEATGEQFPTLWVSIGLIIGLPLIALMFVGFPALSMPSLQGFNFAGGGRVTPEFVALLIGLVTYTAGFIAEIVRSGIIAVHKGQTEAASALGLKRGQSLRLVILPQALRVIIPPMTSQYLNITKNSSLAVAIGYPDIVSIANTALNQTGQAIEGIATIMAVYLTISLSISIFMNWYNARIRFRER